MLGVGIALPFVEFSHQNPNFVKFSKYVGPVVSKLYEVESSKLVWDSRVKNIIDPVWAEETISKFKPEKRTIRFGDVDDLKCLCIVRERVEGCYLSKNQPEWFTAGNESDLENWKENFFWYGDVTLVKDTIHFKDMSVKTDYYLCRGKNAKKFGPPFELISTSNYKELVFVELQK